MQSELWLGRRRLTLSDLRVRVNVIVRAVANERLFIALMTMLAALVRLPTLGRKSLWYDELISISVASHSVSTILSARLRVGASDAVVDQLFTNNPPLHLLLIHVVRFVSTSETAMRLPFAISGVVAMPVAFLVIQRLLGIRSAIAGTLLFAISPLHISYSQEARPTALMVLFSLCGLLFLLKAVDGGHRRNWVWFVLFGVLNVWSSYFALIAVMPTLGVVWLILLLECRQKREPAARRSILANGILSFVGIAIGTLPLIKDLVSIAGMNDAQAAPATSMLASVLDIWWLLFNLANPIPDDRLTSMLAAGMVTGGLLAVLRLRTHGVAIVIAWVFAPCVLLKTIQSDHIVNYRYVLASLPMILALATVGGPVLIPPPIRRKHPRFANAFSSGLLIVLIALNVLGIRNYEAGAITTGPIKPDWHSVVSRYAEHSGPESCLVVVDGVGNAFSQVVPYYIDRATDSSCSVDARDPGLLGVAASHPDLWWAVSDQWYFPEQREALTETMKSAGDLYEFDFVMLLHPEIATGGGDTIAMEALLLQLIDTAEPDRCRSSIVAPAVRESLANLYILENRDPAGIVSLITGFDPPMNDNDGLMWDRAFQRLERGDVIGARTIAIRLVALYPGEERVYLLMSEIEREAGHDTWRSFERVAGVLAESGGASGHSGRAKPCDDSS